MSIELSDSRAWLAVLAVLLGACLFALVSARCQACRERKLLRQAARVASEANAVVADADSAIRRIGCFGFFDDSPSDHNELSAGIARLHGLQNRAAQISGHCGDLAKALPGKPPFFAAEGLEILRIEAADLARMRSELEREVARLETWAERRWLKPALANASHQSMHRARVIGPT